MWGFVNTEMLIRYGYICTITLNDSDDSWAQCVGSIIDNVGLHEHQKMAHGSIDTFSYYWVRQISTVKKSMVTGTLILIKQSLKLKFRCYDDFFLVVFLPELQRRFFEDIGGRLLGTGSMNM